MTRHNETITNDLIASHVPAIRDLIEALRRLIATAVPEASEQAYSGWHSINYRHPTRGYFCGIFPREEYVDLVFEFGVLLPDPDGLLQGEGKQVRFVRFTSEADIRPKPLQKLLLAALNLPSDKATKMAMIQSGARLL